MNQSLVVTSVESIADDVVGITLAHSEGKPVEKWSAGAHLELRLPSGLIRHYSLIGDCSDLSKYQIAVLKVNDGRGGSLEIHKIVRPGDPLVVGLPRNNFPLVDAQRYLFIAGGIGITPMLPMLAELNNQGKPWTMMYGGRTRSSMAFLAELAAVGEGAVDVFPEDERGRMPIAEAMQQVDSGTAVYCCGPSGLLDVVSDAAAAAGVADRLYVERFAPSENPAGAAAAGANSEFVVTLASTGTELRVPADKSILDVVETVAPDVLSSCREGYCGTCEVRVLEGVPEHRDTVLSAAEKEANNSMMICVSRACSPGLVLDL